MNSLEALKERIMHVKLRLAFATTDFDRYYWSLRLRDLEKMLNNKN